MKAAILERYDKHGTELAVKEISDPVMYSQDLLVRVLTAGVNPLDNMIIRKEVELIVPYRPPIVMGNELVGIVENMGPGVHGFSKGDRVYARLPLNRIGAFASCAAIDFRAVAKVPEYLSDEEAACVPLAALTAVQAYQLMHAEEGQTLFLSGGSGSLGAIAIPIAKANGLIVYTSGNGKSEERLKKLGADFFVDYRKQKISDIVSQVDNVLDTLGDKALPEEFALMRPNGTLVSLRGLPNLAFARSMKMPLWKRMLFALAGYKYDKMAKKRHQYYRFMFVRADGAQLRQASEILAGRQVQPSVDSVYSLDEVNAALTKVAHGGSNGKTILRIGERH